MSSLKTWSFISTFVKRKLDLQEESFITPAELLDYAEEALKFCESVIHKLNIEDQYFTTVAPLALVSNRFEYDLPSNIYANKIQRVVYNNGSRIYDIPRIRSSGRFQAGAIIDQGGSTTSYSYMLVNNDARSGTKLRLYPRSSETTARVTITGDVTSGSTTVATLSADNTFSVGDYITGAGVPNGTRVESIDTAADTMVLSQSGVATDTTVSLTITRPDVLIWYTRATSVPAVLTDVIDFPEFWSYIAQFIVVNCLKKELGNPRIDIEAMKLKEMEAHVVGTLSNMVPDQDDTIEKDTSAYYDSTGGGYEGYE